MRADTVRFVAADEPADVSVVVVTYNNSHDLPGLVTDLRHCARRLTLRMIVVDNDSADDTAEVAAEHEDIILVRSGGNLGYAGGINRARPHIGRCSAVLILNADLRIPDDAIEAMFAVLTLPRVGVVVPRMVDGNDALDLTLRREPSIAAALGDAVMGRRLVNRPGWSSETVLRLSKYRQSHAVDWATGAALLIRAEVEEAVGDWNEEYFLYSEETEFFRRVRAGGHQVLFEPSAVVKHRGAGSGSSPALAALLAVNRVRYVERHHGWLYSAAFRGAVALAEALRASTSVHRTTLAVVLKRARWADLPKASKSAE
ncbi:glycosyltransferase family 2 protein [Rhodococcus sp. NPDC127528]|uniref:glycosyltransferase family 2 protein n=1 Tax=unclassified Rhodococcus (in: high G+C Gram-positive bacteria) TaxID=192944 RepID=UPI0036269EF3